MTDADERDEARSRRRFLRRLLGERGSLYVEFALVAPLLLAMGAFIFDVAHLTLVRQQLEIGARFAADLESRAPTAFGELEEGAPLSAHLALRTYMAYVTRPAIGTAPTANDVYVTFRQKPLPFQFLGTFLTGNGDKLVNKNGANKTALGLFSGILKGVLDLVSFRSVRYLTEPLAADYTIGATVSMRTQTLFPKAIYGQTSPGWDRTSVLAVQEEPTAADTVVRRWCYMPNRETFVDRRPTYIKATGDLIDKIKKTFKLK